jgi:hypothetical protein
VDQIKSGIATIKRKVQDIEQFHNKALTAIGDPASGILDVADAYGRWQNIG